MKRHQGPVKVLTRLMILMLVITILSVAPVACSEAEEPRASSDRKERAERRNAESEGNDQSSNAITSRISAGSNRQNERPRIETATPGVPTATAVKTDSPVNARPAVPTVMPDLYSTPDPAATPLPTLTPTPTPAPTPTPKKIDPHRELKDELVISENTVRRYASIGPMTLVENGIAQMHADFLLQECLATHWDYQGLKPVHRYTLAGGDQFSHTAIIARYCEEGSHLPFSAEFEFNTLSDGPQTEDIDVYGGGVTEHHHFDYTVIDLPERTKANQNFSHIDIGYAEGEKGHSVMVVVFSTDYVTWDQLPTIDGTTLRTSGTLKNQAHFDQNADYPFVEVQKSSFYGELTKNQLRMSIESYIAGRQEYYRAGVQESHRSRPRSKSSIRWNLSTGCLRRDFPAAYVLPPGQASQSSSGLILEEQLEHTQSTMHREGSYVCLEPFMFEDRNSPVIAPYDYYDRRKDDWEFLESTVREALTEIYREALQDDTAEFPGLPADQVYNIVADRMEISPDGKSFSIEADLAPMLNDPQNGPGIYNIVLWATMPRGQGHYLDIHPVSKYSIWWGIDPPEGGLYGQP